jgi:hypothetical protein
VGFPEHNDELSDLYWSPCVRIVKFRSPKWDWRVARVGEKTLTEFWWENLFGNGQLEEEEEEEEEEGRITLK